jgi:hypothetical protein
MLGSVSGGFTNTWRVSIRTRVVRVQKFILKPYPVKAFDWARAEYTSMYGVVRSSWRRDVRKLVSSGVRSRTAGPKSSAAAVAISA